VEFLIVISPFLIYGGVFAGVILISSLVRRRSPKAGFVALGWTFLIVLLAAVVGALAGVRYANGVFVLTGAILTAVMTARDGYKWGPSWLWLFLGPLGWWILMWSRNNQLDRRRADELVTASPSVPSVAV
jgi:hypothetical protein